MAKCISTISIKTKEGRMHVPCGTCINCLTKKQQDWSFRLHQEKKISKTAHFISLTYDQWNVPIKEGPDKHGELIFQLNLDKRDLQLFMKKLRKHHSKQLKDYTEITTNSSSSSSDIKLRYYAVGEYGPETIRPHYHIILFNLNPKTLSEIQTIWGKGNVDIGHVTAKSITYVTKYVITSRNQYYGHRQKPFSTMSKQPGIGNNYLVNRKWHTDNKNHHVINHTGAKIGLPDYYKNKIFNKLQKENHRLKNEQKLIDKEIAFDKHHEKQGVNPYQIRLEQTKNKIKKANKSNKSVL